MFDRIGPRLPNIQGAISHRINRQGLASNLSVSLDKNAPFKFKVSSGLVDVFGELLNGHDSVSFIAKINPPVVWREPHHHSTMLSKSNKYPGCYEVDVKDKEMFGTRLNSTEMIDFQSRFIIDPNKKTWRGKLLLYKFLTEKQDFSKYPNQHAEQPLHSALFHIWDAAKARGGKGLVWFRKENDHQSFHIQDPALPDGFKRAMTRLEDLLLPLISV
jgi:hypothetical protein